MTRREPPTYGLMIWPVVAFGLALLAFGVACAAERITPGPHEIVLLAKGSDYDIAGRTIIVLSGPYEDRAACATAMKRLVVKVTGARLACFPTEQGRVQ